MWVLVGLFLLGFSRWFWLTMENNFVLPFVSYIVIHLQCPLWMVFRLLDSDSWTTLSWSFAWVNFPFFPCNRSRGNNSVILCRLRVIGWRPNSTRTCAYRQWQRPDWATQSAMCLASRRLSMWSDSQSTWASKRRPWRSSSSTWSLANGQRMW